MDNQQFAPQGAPQFAPPAPEAKKPNPFKNLAFIKRFVILIVAAVVLLASILPTVSCNIEYYEDETLAVRISPIRSVILMFDSFFNYDYDDLEDSLFAETSEAKVEVWYELLEDIDEDDLTAREKNIIAKIFLLSARG